MEVLLRRLALTHRPLTVKIGFPQLYMERNTVKGASCTSASTGYKQARVPSQDCENLLSDTAEAQANYVGSWSVRHHL